MASGIDSSTDEIPLGKLPVVSTSALSYPQRVLRFSPEQYRKKYEILVDVYGEEIGNSWNETNFDSYELIEQLQNTEAEVVYSLCTEGKNPYAESVPSYDIFYYSNGLGFCRTDSAEG